MSGYSKTPLWKKLGYKPDHNACVINGPAEYVSMISPLPENVRFSGQPPYDLVHVFVNDVAQMENYLLDYKNKIAQNGMIWISWYKKASKKQTEVNEDIIRNTALAMQLVDVKVCSVTEEWSGLKMVIPVKHRT